MKISPASVSRRIVFAAFAAGLTLGAVGIGGFSLASAQVSSDERLVFNSINPCRLIDTRAGDKVGPGETLTLTALGSNGDCVGENAIPPDARALSLNVTALGATERTFLTVWGSGDNPGTSNLNPIPGQPPTPNAVNTPLSDIGTFNLSNALGDVHVIADVTGYYADHNHDDRYYTEIESDDRFLTQAELDARYAPLDGLPFLASGTVIDDEFSTASVSRFSGPNGVTATVTESGVGGYTVRLMNTGGLTNPNIQITGIGDPDPGAVMSTGATACALSAAPPASVGNTFVFSLGCFGESDLESGDIIEEDISFEFIVVA